MSVAIVEYGAGNIGSVVNGCRRAGVEPEIARNGAELRASRCQHIILPGVGAVGVALRNLKERDLVSALEQRVRQDGIPLLGICVGMQILAEVCEEFGTHSGLGWLPGQVRRLAPPGRGVRVPHVGWSDISIEPDPLFSGLTDTHFYFVHSNVLECPREYVIARCTYVDEFVCAVRRDNITAVQFHPEKSSENGVTLLRAFLES